MNALVTGGNNGAHAEQKGALCRPVAAAARAVFGPSKYDLRHLVRLVLHGGIIDRHLLAIGQVPSHASFRPRRQLIADADVRERSTSHHAIVPAARSIAVEVVWHDAVILQEAA